MRLRLCDANNFVDLWNAETMYGTLEDNTNRIIVAAVRHKIDARVRRRSRHHYRVAVGFEQLGSDARERFLAAADAIGP